VFYTPLGVHANRFDPGKRDPEVRARIEAGAPERAAIFFPHRFSEEKGIRNILGAYEILRQRVTPEPALVFAGTGPDEALVLAAAQKWPHVHHLGFLDSIDELSKWAASCDLAVALSAFETFGLSTAEAMASGLAVVAADQGAAGELVTDSGCGLTVPYGKSDALAAALERLIREGNLRERGLRGRAHVLPLTWERCFERETAFYQAIVATHREGKRLSPGIRI
jgi:alpha-1,6-mannosyltransferase